MVEAVDVVVDDAIVDDAVVDDAVVDEAVSDDVLDASGNVVDDSKSDSCSFDHSNPDSPENRMTMEIQVKV